MSDVCKLNPPDFTGVEIINLTPAEEVADYNKAVSIAKNEAEKRFEEYMLISWYDRDRDYESPPNTSERGDEFPKDGYIYYGLSHGAKLKVDIQEGRFVFFFTPVEW